MKCFMNLAKYNIINIINTCEQKQTAAGLCARELFSYIYFLLRNCRAALDQATCSIKSAIKEIALDY